MAESTQTASVTTPSAAASTTTPAPQTTGTATTGAATTSATPTGKTYTDADVQRMIQDRVKNLGEYKDVLEALADGGFVPKGASPSELKNMLAQARAEQASQSGDPTEQYRLTAQTEAKSAAQDVEIRVEARLLAEKDPLYSDLSDPAVVKEILPYARMYGGDVKKAYRALYGEQWAERVKSQTEAKLMADLEAKKSRGSESGDSGGESAALGLSGDEASLARNVFGMDPAKYKAYKDAMGTDSQWATHRKLKEKK